MIKHSNLKYVFIDESGEPGLTNSARRYFIMVGIVMNGNQATKMHSVISDERKRCNLSEDFELKFSKTKKDIVKRVLYRANESGFSYYYLKYNHDNYDFRTTKKNIYNNLLIALIKISQKTI